MASPYDVPSAFPMQAMPIGALQPPQGSAYLPTPAPQAPMPDMSQVSTKQLSPFGPFGDVANQYIVNQQQKTQSNGFINQILSQRFQPTDTDVGTSLMRTATENRYVSPVEAGVQNLQMQLAPYTEMSKLQNTNIASQGGATGALVSRLMTENPQMFPSAADALYFLKGGANQGLTSNNGQIAAMPGAGPAKGQIKYGEQTGKNQSDLDFARPTSFGTKQGTLDAERAGRIADKAQMAGNMNSMLDIGEQYLDAASGSGPGSMYSASKKWIGNSDAQTQADSSLKTLSGWLRSNVPRMEGPQSDRDSLLYLEMAGQIGDPTVPANDKRAAIKVIKQLNAKYTGAQTVGAPTAVSSPSGGGFDINSYLQEKGLQ